MLLAKLNASKDTVTFRENQISCNNSKEIFFDTDQHLLKWALLLN